jgi:pimeloyl-ACP methyl ester carboxylesterase
LPDINRTIVSLESATSSRAGHGSYPCQGIYYSGGRPAPKIAFIATHYEIDFSEHYLAEYMAERGFGFLGWNTRFRGNGAYFLLEHALVDIGAGVRWLREEAKIDVVVLLGNSGGASLMAAYQSQATEPNIKPARGLPLPDAAGELTTADLFISLNAHPGRPEVLTAWMDPSVVNEDDPLNTDAELDMFNPGNGPPYDPDFVAKYRRAQTDRNNRITSWARNELDGLQAAGVWDRLFNVYRAWADLRFLDLSLDRSDRAPGCYLGDPKRANYGPFGIGSTSTLRTWLSMWSLTESQCRAAPHLARVRVPSLVLQSTADQGCFPSDARAIHDAMAAEDKHLEAVRGDHYFLDPADRETVADCIADWLRERVT